MALSDDLLLQASLLATLDPGRPRQASLKRAISTAYYALFHLLSADAAKRVSPRLKPAVTARIARTLNHGEMLAVCKPLSVGVPPPIFKQLHTVALTPQLMNVTRMFVALQAARHKADYDSTSVETRPETLDLLNDTTKAFADWKRIRNSDEATVFLAALLFAKRWDR